MKEEKGLPAIAVIATIVSCLCISFLFGLSIYITRTAAGDNFNEAFRAASIVFVVAFMFPCSFTLFILMLMKADIDRKEREQK